MISLAAGAQSGYRLEAATSLGRTKNMLSETLHLPAPFPGNPFVDRPTLSSLEKYLLRRGWTVSDLSEPFTGRVITVAERPNDCARLAYPSFAYHYHGQDREQELRQTLVDLGRIENTPTEALALAITSIFAMTPLGFACRQCGDCCERFRDAFQGRVSFEEVETWQRLGLRNILRFVQVLERPGYRLYKAWVHPRSGEFLNRCPWLARERNGRRLCRIHAYRPLKCRCFPLSEAQAERANCPGLAEGGNLLPEKRRERPERPEPNTA